MQQRPPLAMPHEERFLLMALCPLFADELTPYLRSNSTVGSGVTRRADVTEQTPAESARGRSPVLRSGPVPSRGGLSICTAVGASQNVRTGTAECCSLITTTYVGSRDRQRVDGFDERGPRTRASTAAVVVFAVSDGEGREGHGSELRRTDGQPSKMGERFEEAGWRRKNGR